MRLPPADDLEHAFRQLSDELWRGLAGRRIFITGGTGFVGKWLLVTLAEANRRLALGVRATVLSRDPEAFRAAAPMLAQIDGVDWLRGDVRDFVFPAGEYDTVIHAATDVVAKAAPEEIFDTCIAGTRHVLDFALQAQAQDFLLISSGAVYGRQPADLPRVPESYPGAPDPLLPGSAYGEGKRASEWLVAAAGARTNLRVRSARCFAFVGPYLPLDKHFAIGNFIGAALDGREIVIQGDGTPVRSYLHAADMAAWLWAVLLIGKPGAAYNVGAEEATSIAGLAHRVCEVLGVPDQVRIVGTPDPSRPVERYVPDSGRARAELGLSVPMTLDEAIIRTARWHRAGGRS
ncbi:NAD(P)-dependent oxidoreductase [Massilia sp. CFBP 13647]|nr:MULTISPECIES: NAD(P)-dependent oxidoreductase [unclassified Massilia]MBD8528775.1 NAD(P)-dependent oxidoreductase [Massilia sp. CFBP 13647]MBD8673416.1 NAD(P)-dependent oxidoreductase [Massilia sp. CFBP 13721]